MGRRTYTVRARAEALVREGTISGPVRTVLALVPRDDAEVGETAEVVGVDHGILAAQPPPGDALVIRAEQAP